MKIAHVIGFILVVVGGVNWGLVGLGQLMGAEWNVVHMLLGSWPSVESVVYVLVGLSAVWLAVMHPKECMVCRGGSSM